MHSFIKIHNMKMTKFITVLLAAAFLISCKATKITSTWKADNHVNKPYHNVMVWSILPESDSTLRKQIETHLVNDLVSKGYHAISSLEVYKEKAYKKLSAKEIIGEFKSTGVDAVMSIVLLNKEKEEKYYPGGFFNQPVNNYGRLDQYYSNVYERVLMPGYYVRTTNYYWESYFFEIKNDKLVYSVHTKSFDPYTTDLLAHENGLLIIKDMLKKKIILNQAPPEED